jgi:hypothetical protein
MRLAYVGNFEPSHSTETHVARAFVANGHEVVRLQEQAFGWDPAAVPSDAAFVLWTHTHGLAPERTHAAQDRFLSALNVPSMSFHLDRYWDLYRESQIAGPKQEPFFRTTLMCSADGGNQERWAAAGVDHVWMPPGVSAGECEPGTYRPELASDVAFVGSWQPGYHPESTHRAQLVSALRGYYGERCRFWPAPGEPAVRNEQLQDLYASVEVLVGDSCFSGDPRGHSYFSDRVPETLGRGGLLVHPHTPGVTDGTLYTAGEHLLCWPAGDWSALWDTIDGALVDDKERARISKAGREHVLATATYEVRMRQFVDMLTERGLV